VNWYTVSSVSVEYLASIHLLVFLAVYFGMCWLGIQIFSSSSDPWISFLGYNLVVIPFGLVLNLVVSRYDASIVQDAMRITGLVTAAMMCLGSLVPGVFRQISGALTLALLAMVGIELFEVFVLGIHHDLIDWAVAVIFCAYIGYDWGVANELPRTADNAVDSAARLYMDIINLFVRVLAILGRRR
jgi:FtsH-binding integral membrane protein